MGDPGARTRPGWPRQVALVMGKNIRLKLRNPVVTISELLIPMVFLFFLIPAWVVSSDDDLPAQLRVGSSLNHTEVLANSTCTRNASATGDEYAACPLGFDVRDFNCLGDLCLTLPLPPASGGKSGGKGIRRGTGLELEGDDKVTALMVLAPIRSPFGASIPAYDTMALLRRYANVVDLPQRQYDLGISDQRGNVFDAVSTGYEVAVVPRDAGNAAQVARAAALDAYLEARTYTHALVRRTFPDEAAAVAYATGWEGMNKVWAVVVITGDDGYGYTLRQNHTSVPDTGARTVDTVGFDGSQAIYVGGGFVTMQAMVADFFATAAGGGAAGAGLVDEAVVVPMPIPPLRTNDFLESVAPFMGMILSFALLYPVAQLTSMIVREKEERIREAMLIMGLSVSAFRWSWVFTAWLQFGFCMIFASIPIAVYMPNTNYGLIFIHTVLYGLAVAMFVIVSTAFFSKAATSSTVAPFLFLAQALPQQMLSEDQMNSGLGTLLRLFLPTAAHGGGLNTLAEAARKKEDIGFDTLGEGDFPVGASIGLMIFNIVLYLLLMVYFDSVLPGEWGSKKPFYFPCWPPLWCSGPQPAAGGLDRCINPHLVEPVRDAEKTRSITVDSIRREFASAERGGRVRVAVDNVNLTFYEDQIFSLLGHNGAGKTTLINLLTGMLPATAGDALVYGHSVRSDLSAVRQDLGLCPQHNILWDRLTCEEHLRFFAALKGVPRDEIRDAVLSSLGDVGLDDKVDYFSAGLSGGMKRKLCVAIALVGGSRFVIFDEPTAGMDVEARRSVWEMLKAAKKGRTILLTTHYMDEADLLGDTIAIMTGGRVYCWGSSYFLKQNLGVGYQLKMDVAPSAETKVIQNVLHKSLEGLNGDVRDAELLSAAGSEVCFRLPEWGLPKFEALFERLERDGPGLGVRNYSIGMTTLEELFLKIANAEHGAADCLSPQRSQRPSTAGDRGDAGAGSSSADIPRSGATSGIHVVGESGLDLDVACLTNTHPLQGSALFSSQFHALTKKRFIYAKRDRCTVCLQIVLPIVLIMLAFIFNNFPTADPGPLTLSEIPRQNMPFPVAPTDNPYIPYLGQDGDDLDLDVVQATDAFAFERHLLDTYYGGTVPKKRWYGCYVSGGSLPNATLTAGAEGYASVPLSAVVSRFEEMTPQLGRVVFYNTSSAHSAVRAVGLMGTAAFRAARNDPTATITAVNHPLPKGTYVQNIASSFEAVSLGIFVLIPMAFVPANPVAYLVKERECKAKHVQIVSGVKLSAYWGANFLFDIVAYTFTMMLAFLLFAIFGRSEYIGSASAFFATLMVFFSYGLTSTATSYLASFHFKNPNLAQNLVMLINFLSGFGLVIFAFIMEVLGQGTLMQDLRFVFRLVPSFCLGDAIIQLSLREGFNEIGLQDKGPWDLTVTGYSIIYLLLSFPVYMILALAHDYPQLRVCCRGKAEESEAGGIISATAQDDDVMAETVRVLGSSVSDDTVSVRRLRKVYGNGKVAVNDLTFGIKQGEIFGFLGTNGAGKTTTISVIAGEFGATAGDAYVKGFNVATEPQEAKRELGFCPQFDALIDLLTPVEQLELYAGLRGVPKEQRRQMIDGLIRLLGLESHVGTVAMRLSGGNKRKTSIAMALIGGPACVLLDEPTAGMDPVARRGMWRTLQLISANRSVLLTTHHLEEVEALAHRMGIMVDGALKCVGTLGHLRAKFGGSQQFDINTRDPQAEARVMEWFPKSFPDSNLVERTNLRLTYQINAKIPLSQLFGRLEAAKAEVGIVDYAISETSMEQVFTAICKQSQERQRAEQARLEAIEAQAVVSRATSSRGNSPASSPHRSVRVQPASPRAQSQSSPRTEGTAVVEMQVVTTQ